MHSTLKKLIPLGCWLFVTFEAHAEVLRWPQNCPAGILEIQNTTTRPVQAWLQKFTPALAEETELTIPARSRRDLAVENLASPAYFSLLHFSKPEVLSVTYKCNGKNFSASSVEGGILTFKPSDLAKNILYLQNLFFDSNTIHIEYFDSNDNLIETKSVTLTRYQKLDYELTLIKSAWKSVRIHAENRFTAFNLNSKGSTFPNHITPKAVDADHHAQYFVVGDRQSPVDSFVIKLTDPAMIAKAREQLTNPRLEKIVFARIQKGHGQFNRNWSKKEKSFWSWSTSEVTNISDLGSTSCNGLPQAVEDRAEMWIGEPGRICFWSYRIQSELTADEVALGQRLP